MSSHSVKFYNKGPISSFILSGPANKQTDRRTNRQLKT